MAAARQQMATGLMYRRVDSFPRKLAPAESSSFQSVSVSTRCATDTKDSLTHTQTHTHLCVVATLAVDGRQEAVTFDTAAFSGYDVQGHLLCLFGTAGHG